MAVAEFARIRGLVACLNSGEFGYIFVEEPR